VTAHVDILDARESWRKPLLLSVALHGSLVAAIALVGVVGNRPRDLWGSPNSLGGASVGITPVSQIPLPSRGGPVNPLAEQEYRETEERAGFLAEQRRDLEASLDELSGVIADLDRHIESTFAEMFSATQKNFADMVQLLFPGGRGLLRLEDQPVAEVSSEGDEQPTGEREGPGIVLEIKPPRKAPRSMSLLSGGEKALAALSFLFALFLARPCPFYVLDEVEAALDDMNLGRFLTLVKRYQDQTQFIIITHQRRTMEIADTIYGVAMDADGTSRVLSRRLSLGGAARS